MAQLNLFVFTCVLSGLWVDSKQFHYKQIHKNIQLSHFYSNIVPHFTLKVEANFISL